MAFASIDDQITSNEGNTILTSIRVELFNLASLFEKKSIDDVIQGNMHNDFIASKVGSTASIVYIDEKDKKVHIANVGDSPILMSTKGVASRLSKNLVEKETI